MPAISLPPAPAGVPHAPGPAIFTDGTFPPVPTATSSVVPEISSTTAPASTELPPVLGPGYVSPPGVVDSEISRLLSTPADLGLTTSTLKAPSAEETTETQASQEPDANAADGDLEAVDEEDLDIPDNQSPLGPIGNEHGHDNFWRLEQPRVRYGPPKKADKVDRFGNPPGWPIPFSVSFDEYVLPLDEPQAPPKPSLRGQDITTGGDEWPGVKKRVKKRGEIIIVPDLDSPFDLDVPFPFEVPTTDEVEEAPKEGGAPEEETPEQEEGGHALKARGDGEPQFSDYRLDRENKKRKKKTGKLAGTRDQEDQPLEYPFHVDPRLDNEEKPIWPFHDGFDDVAYDKRKGKFPCVIL